MPRISARMVSERIERLIAQYDGGDHQSAGRRLGIGAERLQALLSGDWRRFSLEDLALLVRGYSVPADSIFSLNYEQEGR